MESIKIGNNIVQLFIEDGNVRIKSGDENIILINQSINTVYNLIRENFYIVHDFYRSTLHSNITKQIENDLDIISIKIVFHYLYIYNMWKNQYNNQKDRSLRFDEKDFQNPSTADIIIGYFKDNYVDWKLKACVLLNMTISQFEDFYIERENFYNK